MIKNYKVRLELNNKQHSRMLQFAGAARYTYNWALEQQNKCYKDSGKFLSDCDLRKQFTQYKQTNTWLYDISNEVTKQAIKDAVIAFSNFFKGRAGYPRFKTKNIVKAELALLKLNHKLTNIRRNYIHQVTNEIISRKPRFIVLEDLNVKDVMKNRHLSKAIQQQSLAEFAKILKYKAKQNNIEVICVDRFFPSSKTCSCCGAVKQNLKLTERLFVCNECGLKIDRDYNASLNLCRLGCSTAMSAGINVCGVSHQTEVVSTKQDTKKQKLNRSLKAS